MRCLLPFVRLPPRPAHRRRCSPGGEGRRGGGGSGLARRKEGARTGRCARAGAGRMVISRGRGWGRAVGVAVLPRESGKRGWGRHTHKVQGGGLLSLLSHTARCNERSPFLFCGAPPLNCTGAQGFGFGKGVGGWKTHTTHTQTIWRAQNFFHLLAVCPCSAGVANASTKHNCS
jgi:hypothetical protein